MKFNNRISIAFLCLLIAFTMNGCSNKKYNSNPYLHESTEDISEQSILHFNFDSSTILTEDYDKLDTVATYYISGDGKDDNIVIYGHTDEIGTSSYNLALGKRRANSIKNYLENKGMNPKRIEIVSLGFANPAISGSTEEARTANRRAQIIKK